jgi:O-antigen/teichoic acid export membrane protein
MVETVSSPAAPPRSRFVRNVTWLSISQLVSWGLTLVWTLFVPRALGPSGMGLLALGWAASAMFGVVASLGTRTLLVKEIAADRRVGSRLIGAVMIARAGLMVPSLVVILGYILLGHFDADQRLVLLLALGVTLLNLATEPLQAAFQGIERMEYLAYADMASKLVLTACSIALVLIGFRAIALVTVWMVLTAAVLGLNVYWIRQYFRIDFGARLAAIRSVIIGSLAYWSTILFQTIYQWLDSIMLVSLTNISVVGLYGVPTRLLGATFVFPVILATAWLPRLSGAFRQGEEALRTAARPVLELGMVISLPLTIGVVVTAGPVIRLLYGQAFAQSIPVLAILALTMPAVYLNILVNQILVATDRQILWTKVMAAGTVVKFASNLVLIRIFQERIHNGAVGAALSLVVTEVLICLVGLTVIRSILGRKTLERVGRTVVAALLMGGAVVLAARFGLGAQVATGVVVFTVLALLLRVISDEELAVLRQVGSRFQRRPAVGEVA